MGRGSIGYSSGKVSSSTLRQRRRVQGCLGLTRRPVRRHNPRVRFPHPLTLLVGCVLVAALASHVLPPGEYDRRDDAATGRRVVVPGTYHAVAPRPVTAVQALLAIPRGMGDAAAVIFFVFLIGGAFTVVDETGALRQGVNWLVRRFGHAERLVIPVAALAFALGGVLDNMKEEIIALVPVMLLLARRLGAQPVIAVATSLGAAAVGAAFSPINPFQVRSEEHTSELQSRFDLVCRLLLEKKKKNNKNLRLDTYIEVTVLE